MNNFAFLEQLKRLKTLWIIGVICSYLGLNYIVGYGRWLSLLGTILIITFSYLAWPSKFTQLLGIPRKAKQLIITIILVPILFTIIYLFVYYISFTNSILMTGDYLIRPDHLFFYTLNEELILGALLLFSIRKILNDINPVFISSMVAAVFSIMHFIMYKWIFETHAEIHILTLISLFAIGIVRNNLILHTGHIGYSWVLHYIWIKITLGFHLISRITNRPIGEVETFNIFLGNGTTVLIASILAVATSFLFFFKKPVDSQI